MAEYNHYPSHLGRYSGLQHQDPPGHWPQDSNFEHSYSHNSHYSHATPSTHSWVQSQPYPPLDHTFEDPTPPLNAPRPLPPHPVSERPFTHHPSYADPIEEVDEEPEYMNIDPADASGQYEYPEHYQQQHGRFNFFPHAGPSNWRQVLGSPSTSEPIIPVVASTPSPPAEKKRSFVGGFFKGFKRLPKKIGYGTRDEKGRPVRRGTLEESEGANGQGRGNTLPEYRSNPGSPSYGGAEYVPDIQTAFAGASPIPNVVRSPGSDGTAIPLDRIAPPDRNLPPSLMAGPTRRELTPSFIISPPSDEISHDSHHDSYQSHHESQYSHRSGQTQVRDGPQPQYVQVVHPDPTMSPNNAERTTVMVYSDSAAGTHSGVPMSDPGLQRVPSRTPRTSGGPPRQSTITIQTPIRLSEPPTGAQAPASQVPASQGPQTGEDTVTSPATAQMPPTADYRKMSSFPGSPWSRTTDSSCYNPSFASQRLTPVERFFKTLYHLPWVSHGRVTVDYRPGATPQGRSKSKGIFKKPMSSWYRRLSRSGRKSQELDLFSSGTMSIPDITQRTSMETSMVSSIPTSPRSGKTGRRHTTGSDSRRDKSGGHSSGHRRHRHRHHHRRRRSMSTIEEPTVGQHDSPMLPPVYPYPYPAYPYTYPGYAAMAPGMPGTPGILMPSTPPTTPGAAQQHIPVQVIAAPMPVPAAQPRHRSSSKSLPRGPRTRGHSSSRRPTYPGGYAPYQTMGFPPLYFQGTPPSPPAAAVPTTTPQQQQQPQLFQYVPVQVVPGGFNSHEHFYATAGSIPSPPSSPTPRAGFTASPAAS